MQNGIGPIRGEGVDWVRGIRPRHSGVPGHRQCPTHREESVIEVEHLGAHEVLGTDSTENDNVAPNTLITKDTNTAVSVQTSKGLRDL